MEHKMAQAGVEVASVGVILGHFVGYLPAVATVFAVVWYAISIWESHTVQNWRERRRLKRLTPPTPGV